MDSAITGGDAMIRLDPGEEIHASLKAWAKEHGVKAAAITSGIGRIRETSAGFLDGEGVYRAINRVEPMELLTLMGNLALHEGEPFTHLHITGMTDDHEVVGGHLFSSVVHITAEIHLRILESMPMIRCPLEGSEFIRLEFE